MQELMCTNTTRSVFLEVFATRTYRDVSIIKVLMYLPDRCCISSLVYIRFFTF